MEEKSPGMSKKMQIGLLLTAVLVTGVALSWGAHKEHILGFAPYMVLLLCPIMHLFMHGKHGKH